MRAEVITADHLEAVNPFLAAHRQAMLYHDPAWLRLVATLTGADVSYVAIRDGEDEFAAVVPIAIKRGPCGSVANSSPYFGSHGGVLATSPKSFSAACAALVETLRARGVVAANVIEPLFSSEHDLYRSNLPVAVEDRRIGQYKSLEGKGDRDSLLASLSGLVRSNLKRRAWRSGVRVFRDDTPHGLRALYEMHAKEMSAKAGGNPKTWPFFDLLSRHLQPGKQWRVYFGAIDGELAAGLLLFYWREYVEYFTPAFRAEYREHQPASAVMFEAMLDAATEGFRCWNFGGTWVTQEGVKAFKDSWASTNRDYHYFVLDFGGLDALRHADRAQLLEDYYGFYLYPFR